MTLGERLAVLFTGQKESLARVTLIERQVGQPQSTPINYENLAKIGYAKSALAYTCIQKIAGSTRSFKWGLYDKSNPRKPKELEKHPMLSLWDRPNPMTSNADFVENLIAYFCLTGNSYVESNNGLVGSVPLELWNVRPDKMKIEPGPKGYPQAFIFDASGTQRRFEVDIVKMKSAIHHWKTFNPLNDWYGMAPLQAAMLALDQMIAGQQWNLALLQNSATPSGVLQVKVSDANPRGELTDEQYKRMRNDYEANYTGVRNTGKPMIIEGGLTWTQMSHSPRDIDYAKGKELSATDICLVFGVPPELVNLGQKTFNNYREARLSFFEETVLPIADSAIQGINRWLAPAFGNENLCLEYDKDSIDILVWKREQKYTSLAAVNFLTQNEKREAVGYEPQEEWEDVFVIGNQVGATPEDFQGATSGAEPGAGGDPLSEEDLGEDDKPEDDKPGADEKPDDSEDEKPVDDGADESAKGWKSINLLSANEKRSSWKAQNARRKRLQGAFNRDLDGDFKELISRLKLVTGNRNDAKLTEFALLQELSEVLPEFRKTVKRHIRYTLEDFGGMILGEGKTLGFDRESKANLKYDHYVKHYTETRSGENIKSITQTTTKKIKQVVGEWVQTAIVDGDSTPELSHFIESEFEELTPAMATRIARTEVMMASSNGAREAIKSLQIPNMFKEWVAADVGDRRDGHNGGPDHQAVSGTEVPFDEKFTVPPDADMDGPGDTSAAPDQVINCACVLVYRSKN
jgi:HK97 family phage portal protein